MNDEKKKIIILGCLGAVILCVGAFQIMGGKKPPPPPATPTPSSSESASTSDSTDVADATSATKPALGPDGKPLPSGAVVLKNPQVATPLPVRDPFQPPASAMPVVSMYHPFHPQVSRVNSMGRIITPLGGSTLGPVTPSAPTPIPPAVETPFTYKLVGCISGDRPAALLQDSAGNQKVVPVGDAIDGESRLVSIGQGSVTVLVRGKELRLSMGGNPVEK